MTDADEHATNDTAESEPVPQAETTAAEAAVVAADQGVVPVASPVPAPAPGTDADAALVEAVGRGLTWIPYAVYLALWLALAGASAWLLRGATPEQPARWLEPYGLLVWTGVGLAIAGPLLSLAVWLIARSGRTSEERAGLLTAAVVRGALTTFFGAVVWVVTLYAIETLTLGGAL